MRKVNPWLWAALAGAVGLWLFSRTTKGSEVIEQSVTRVLDMTQPRGIRNNNPGNIERKNVVWQGMSADQSGDPRFIVFDSPEYGVRAMTRIIRNYMARGQRTISQIIATWAPPSENDTVSYVNAVSSSVGIGPNDPVQSWHMPALIAAIIQHENGDQPYSPEVIAQGISLEQTA